MYYNIKIKSNGSEFSLETNHKDVLEREMDLYFACIFNASSEFKSKIKKIEITNENLKLIENFEFPKQIEKPISKLDDEKIHELAKLKAQEIIKSQQLKIEQEIPAQAPSVPAFEPIVELKQQVQNELPTISQIPTEVVKFQNEPTQLEEVKPQVVNTIQSQEPSIVSSELPEEIMELINLAQKKIQTIEKITALDISKNIQNIPMETKKEILNEQPVSEYEQSNLNKLNDIFSTPTPTQEEEIANHEPVVQTPQLQQEAIFSDSIEVSLADIEVSLEPQVENKQEMRQQEEQDDIEKEEKKEELTNEVSRVPLAQLANQMDFKPFLAGYKCEELSDEFLVCAYFIKNVLKQNDFTMKFINSKLFQATGKIADMSVIDELTTKEYIRVIETEEGKKYSITMDGEGYFAATFQG